jgi:hypothetical protein
MVTDHQIRGDQCRTPALTRWQQHQTGPQAGTQPGTHLPGTVTMPDVGMQDRSDPVLVQRKLGEQGTQQLTAPPQQRGAPQVELTAIIV